VGLKAHRSFIIQHTKKLSEKVTSSNPWMIEADLNWHMRKRSTWDYCHCYPRTGVSFIYTNFDLPGILGDAISAYAFIEPFINSDRRLNYSIRFGMGPSYLTTLYDAVLNPDNLFFSSHVSFLIVLNAAVNYRATPRLTLQASGSYNHISNGGYSEPNLGINFPSISLGLDYSFRDIELPNREPIPSKTTLVKKHRVDILFGLSAKPTSAGLHEKRYPVYVLGADYSRTVGRILALNGGLEWVIDRAVYKTLREKGQFNDGGEYPDHNRAGLLMGIDWLFGRFIFYQHFGIYLYSPVKPRDPVYQRYGLNFRLTENVFTGLNIKAHGQDADFMDVRVGWSF
jgi:hypothetical protein